MKLAIASDLHLEFGNVSIRNTEDAEILVLAGDIVPARQIGEFLSFFDEVTEEFPIVFYVLGNHEHYGCEFKRTRRYIEVWLMRYPNLYILDNTLTHVNGISFVGATMWTNLNREDPVTMFTVKNYMNDFRIIAGLTPEKTIDEFNHSLSVIQNSAAKVVITHHAPCNLSIAEKYATDHHMNGGFYSELGDYIANSSIALWIHGHMHNASDYMIGNTRVICNPRGYHGYEDVSNWQVKYVEI